MAVATPALLAATLPSCARQPTQLEAAITWADSALARAVADERVPGAVLLIAQNGRVIHERAYGYARLYEYSEPKLGGREHAVAERRAAPTGDSRRGLVRLAEPEPMTPAHIFDLASVTKVMATTFGLMLLVDHGQLDLDAPVHTYLPEFRGPDKDRIRVRDLLTHGAGLYRWLPIYYHARTETDAYEYIRGLPLAFPIREQREYSDLGFMLLGYIIERVSGEPLDVFVAENLYSPLGLSSTAFSPRDKGLGPFAATSHGNPYERRMVTDDDFGYRVEEDPASFRAWRDYTLAGEVSDGNAHYAHGGVAGHAGLFSTASDLHVLLNVLLNGGVHEGRRVVSSQVVAEFLRPQAFGNGLGWAMAPGTVGLEDPPEGSFGHTGFTGTYVLGVPGYELAVVLLTNRENVGVDDAGYYPDVDEFRRPILERLVAAAAADAGAT